MYIRLFVDPKPMELCSVALKIFMWYRVNERSLVRLYAQMFLVIRAVQNDEGQV